VFKVALASSVVCIDEKSKQLLEDGRQPIPMTPGRVAKYDYEYKRNGTRNIFAAVEPKAETEQVLDKIMFYYTPKHASWLNMAEIEINAMAKEYMPDKIGSELLLKQ
jgi:hypothetical protein